MAITIRKVDQLRPHLDRYKKEHFCGTDSGAIAAMVSEHHQLVGALREARECNRELRQELSDKQHTFDQLRHALAPFVERSSG